MSLPAENYRTIKPHHFQAEDVSGEKTQSCFRREFRALSRAPFTEMSGRPPSKSSRPCGDGERATRAAAGDNSDEATGQFEFDFEEN